MMKLRNIAIIAHVDHGKTTLVDRLLQQSGAFRDNQRVAERVMDSNDLERERGITILAKATSVVWKDVRVNIVDTPGHADFGGEVERILSMVDGAIVAGRRCRRADAADQVRARQGAEDRAEADRLRQQGRQARRASQRGASTRCSTFSPRSTRPTSSSTSRSSTAPPSRAGCRDSPDGPKDDMAPLFDQVLKHVEPPKVGAGGFRMLGTLLEGNPYLGRIVTGRVFSGSIKTNTPVKVLDREGELVETGRVSQDPRLPRHRARADRRGVCGRHHRHRGPREVQRRRHAVRPRGSRAAHAQPIDPPTLSMTFSVNDCPLAGTEGDKVTSRVIRDRLFKEAEGNVALRVEPPRIPTPTCFGPRRIAARVLIETMRREGFELGVSRPQGAVPQDEDGEMLEPIEEVVIDVDEEHSGVVVQKMSDARAR